MKNLLYSILLGVSLLGSPNLKATSRKEPTEYQPHTYQDYKEDILKNLNDINTSDPELDSIRTYIDNFKKFNKKDFEINLGRIRRVCEKHNYDDMCSIIDRVYDIDLDTTIVESNKKLYRILVDLKEMYLIDHNRKASIRAYIIFFTLAIIVMIW